MSCAFTELHGMAGGEHVRSAYAHSSRLRRRINPHELGRRKPALLQGHVRHCGQPRSRQLAIQPERLPIVQVEPDKLLHTLTSLPVALSPSDVDAVFQLARRSTTWTTPRPVPGLSTTAGD